MGEYIAKREECHLRELKAEHEPLERWKGDEGIQEDQEEEGKHSCCAKDSWALWEALRLVSYIDPLTYAVEAFRFFLNDSSSMPIQISIGVLVAFLAAMTYPLPTYSTG
jgi:hypothetical protein